MNHTRRLGSVGALAIVGIAGVLRSSRADEVIIARMTASPSGGMRSPIPATIKLSETKPTGITKEPNYLHTPLYGTITLGDAKDAQRVVVLDSAANATVSRLYIDSNGNGDLTDEPPVPLVKLAASTVKNAAVNPGTSFGARVVLDARYKSGPGVATVPSGVTLTVTGTELSYNREYSREGRLVIGPRSYRVALIDMALDGKYGNYKHESGQPPKVVLLIDRNGNGNFDVPTDANGALMLSSTRPVHLAEACDVMEPFRIGGLSYEVATMDSKGTTISLKRSAVNVRDSMTAADLRVGGDAIAFNAERLDGKKVSFPEDYKGKIVLIDFWATFSPDYRAEAPGIAQTYSQYHADGFEILGVSVDKSGGKQMIAEYLEQMGIAWPQIYDGGYYKAEVASLYGVQSIPNSVLVDGDTGRILAMGNSLRGAGLVDAVANALANKKR